MRMKKYKKYLTKGKKKLIKKNPIVKMGKQAVRSIA